MEIKKLNFDINKLYDQTCKADLYERFPHRCPVFFVIEALKEMTENKRFCDLGCGGGDLVKEFAIYAKESIGVDNCERGELAKQRGVNVICGNYEDITPEADVYFFWAGAGKASKMAARCFEINPECSFVICGRKGMDWHKSLMEEYPEKSYILEFNYKELLPDDSPNSFGPFQKEGTWWLCVIKK